MLQLTKQNTSKKSSDADDQSKVVSRGGEDATMEEGLLEGREVPNTEDEETTLLDPKKGQSASYSTFKNPQATEERSDY